MFIMMPACKPAFEIQKSNQIEYVFSDSSNASIDSTVYGYIKPFREKLSAEMNTVLAKSEVAMERGIPESRLGNFVADACMVEVEKIYNPSDGHKADFAFFNNGGLRRSLPQGTITKGDVFELMPFENELVVLTVNGNVVKKIFNFIASKRGAPISGARFSIQDGEARNITIQRQNLDMNKTYKVLTSDYLANGGDSYDFLSELPRENVNLKVRDAIIQYLVREGQANRIISIQTDGRIINAE